MADNFSRKLKAVLAYFQIISRKLHSFLTSENVTDCCDLSSSSKTKNLQDLVFSLKKDISDMFDHNQTWHMASNDEVDNCECCNNNSGVFDKFQTSDTQMKISSNGCSNSPYEDKIVAKFWRDQLLGIHSLLQGIKADTFIEFVKTLPFENMSINSEQKEMLCLCQELTLMEEEIRRDIKKIPYEEASIEEPIVYPEKPFDLDILPSDLQSDPLPTKMLNLKGGSEFTEPPKNQPLSCFHKNYAQKVNPVCEQLVRMLCNTDDSKNVRSGDDIFNDRNESLVKISSDLSIHELSDDCMSDNEITSHKNEPNAEVNKLASILRSNTLLANNNSECTDQATNIELYPPQKNISKDPVSNYMTHKNDQYSSIDPENNSNISDNSCLSEDYGTCSSSLTPSSPTAPKCDEDSATLKFVSDSSTQTPIKVGQEHGQNDGIKEFSYKIFKEDYKLINPKYCNNDRKNIVYDEGDTIKHQKGYNETFFESLVAKDNVPLDKRIIKSDGEKKTVSWLECAKKLCEPDIKKI